MNFKVPSNTILKGVPEGRNLDTYEKILTFNKQDLVDEIILDLGCSKTLKLSTELKEFTRVISLSYDFRDERHRKEISNTVDVVAAIGEQLPFADANFDRVLALNSVATWSQHNYKYWLPEICRVLKKGGKAHIGPVKYRTSKCYIYDTDHGQYVYQSKQRLLAYLTSALGNECEVTDHFDGYCTFVITKTI